MSAVEFMRLFAGNTTAYGGDEGKAVRVQHKTQWQHAVMQHWSGAGPAVGVYPLVCEAAQSPHGPVWFVKWGCVDFDIKSEGHAMYDYETEAEAHVAATNLQRVLAAFGICSWVERTRSHGRHVWIFVDAWTVACNMRECLLVATEIAGVSQREVNPKSDGSNLEADQLGNYVRLPYSGEELPETRVVFIGGSEVPLRREIFVTTATEQRATPADIAKVADLYREPVVAAPMSVDESGVSSGTFIAPPVVQHVILNGPNDGDRSKGLLYIAHECHKAGLPPKQALELVMIADESWGKYVGRRDREQRLQEIIERAWK